MMRRRRVLMCATGAVAALGAVLMAVPAAAGGRAVAAARWPVPAGTALASWAWGKAVEVPGLGSLNKGWNAGVLSVSCTSAGNCAAGGYYTDGHGHRQGFVVSEKPGKVRA